MDNNDQILDEFLLEAQEIFDQLDLDFVALEQNPDDKKLVGNIFRAMHTLKGSSGFFAFHRLEKVAHAGESLLSKIRDGALGLNEEITDALLGTSDRLREIDHHQHHAREEDGAAYMQGEELVIGVDLGLGRGKRSVWTCDLTNRYVEINADYRS